MALKHSATLETAASLEIWFHTRGGTRDGGPRPSVRGPAALRGGQVTSAERIGVGGAGDMPVSCTQWRNLETDPVPGIFPAVRSPWRRAWRGGGRRFMGDFQALG